MAATLTEKIVRSASAREKPYEVPDRGGKKSVRELILRVQPTGVKTFYVQIARGRREKIGGASSYTLSRARNRAREILGKAAEGHDFQAERRHKSAQKASTLGSYLDGPYKDHAEANIASHRPMLAGLKKHFSHVLNKPMGEITEFDLAKWRKNRSNVTLATQRRELANLKAVLNYAVRKRVIPSHQIGPYRVTGTLQGRQSTAKLRFLSEVEEKRLRAGLDAREARIRKERASANEWRAARGYPRKPEIGPKQYADYLKPLILIALNTGLRRGDLLGLEWAEVDLRRRQIRKVIGKTSHAVRKAGRDPAPATLPLSVEAHAVLSQQQAQKQEDSDLVFVSPRTGGRLDNIKKAFEGVLQDAKIDNFRFHDLRHTFASRLVMAGVDINTVRELMTHADIKMTLIYAHLSPDHKAAAIDRAFGERL